MTSLRKITANQRNAARSTGPKTSAGRSRSSRNAVRHGLESAHFSEHDNSELVDRIADAICNGDADPSCRLLARIIAEQHVFLSRVRAARVAAVEKIFEQLEKSESAKPGLSSDCGENDTECALDHERQNMNENESKDENGDETEGRIIWEATHVSNRIAKDYFLSRMEMLLIDSEIPTVARTLTNLTTLSLATAKLDLMRAKQLPEHKRVKMRKKVVRLTKSLNEVLEPPHSTLDRAWSQLVGMERYERRALSKRRRAIRRLAEMRN